MRDYAPPVYADAAMRLVAPFRLSWSEPQSPSNLPKDPPSKRATLHKKDDTDTRIIFKLCGTACSLLRCERLPVNFLLYVSVYAQHTNLDKNSRDKFYGIPKMLYDIAHKRNAQEKQQTS